MWTTPGHTAANEMAASGCMGAVGGAEHVGSAWVLAEVLQGRAEVATTNGP